MTAPVLPPNAETFARAASCLEAGGLVAVPTETVYGLAADAANEKAVARLYAAKGRPRFNPLIAHIPDRRAAEREGRFSPVARQLADAFWPGPLTLVLPVAETGTVCELARAGLESVALRAPNHPVAASVLEAFGRPLVAPSANPSGKISPTEAAHVASDLGDVVDLILDGGPCQHGIESTIVSCLAEAPQILRPGTITQVEIEAVVGSLDKAAAGGIDKARPIAPGQLSRHYAPDAHLRLDAEKPEPSEAYLGFGPGPATANLSEASDLVEAASRLFRLLRWLDERHDRIAVAPIPRTGLGLAINDRLALAAKRD
ncbi:MAG: L-threonylcarbamoyladenylate synthase [Pseudomonadota bacterium]